MSFNAFYSSPKGSSLKILGDVNSVLEGTVKDSELLQIDLSQVLFALGAGTFFDSTKIGETLVFNHEAFVCYVDQELKTKRAGEGLISPFLLTLEKSDPCQCVHFSSIETLSLEEIYAQLIGNYKALAIVGCAHFETLASTYLKIPPIFHESINDNVKKYWADTENKEDAFGYFFAVVISENGREYFDKSVLSKAFYKNPHQTTSQEIMSHSHVALLKGNINLTELKKDPVSIPH